jgi:hypothetical protein
VDYEGFNGVVTTTIYHTIQNIEGIHKLATLSTMLTLNMHNSRATGIKVLKRVMNHKNNKDNVAHLNKKLIFPVRSQDQAPMELISEVEDEEETPTCPSLPSASPLPLSNPVEQD